MGRGNDLQPVRGGKGTDQYAGHGAGGLDSKGTGDVWDLRGTPSFRILPPFLRNPEV